MGNTFFRNRIRKLLASADIIIDGTRPWDIVVHDERCYRRVLLEGRLGAGESYMDGWWDCLQLDELCYRILRDGIDRKVSGMPHLLHAAAGHLMNLQRDERSWEVGRKHYDIGNDLYRTMLDPLMIYSGAYWRNASTLEEAQELKLRMVFEKLGLKPGMRTLDIGCGWGGAAAFAARNYGVEVIGLTISAEQAKLARERCQGLPVEIRLESYEKLKGTFECAWSIGMMEHVGHKNYHRYFSIIARHLSAEGRFLLQTIGCNRPEATTDPWTERYIFPNSMLPSASQLAAASEGLFVLEDWHVFGPDYDRTLMAWNQNTELAGERLRGKYGERFLRMWRYYLLSSAGAFRARKIQLWQVLLSKNGLSKPFR